MCPGRGGGVVWAWNYRIFDATERSSLKPSYRYSDQRPPSSDTTIGRGGGGVQRNKRKKWRKKKSITTVLSNITDRCQKYISVIRTTPLGHDCFNVLHSAIAAVDGLHTLSPPVLDGADRTRTRNWTRSNIYIIWAFVTVWLFRFIDIYIYTYI